MPQLLQMDKRSLTNRKCLPDDFIRSEKCAARIEWDNSVQFQILYLRRSRSILQPAVFLFIIISALEIVL